MRRAARVDETQAEIVAALRAAGASVWTCAGGCGKSEKRPPSKMSKLMCSPCRLASYRGKGNPNFRGASEKRCMLCGCNFNSYNKTRVYCSMRCYHLTRPAVPSKCPAPQQTLKQTKPPKPTRCPKPPRVSAMVTANCKHCAVEFTFPRSARRLYCSYACHLKSGGAKRAGQASKGMVMRYGAKKDANHADVVKALSEMGVSVIDTSHVGYGFPDLVLGWARQTLMMEIKNPKTAYGRKGLNKRQLQWKEDWRGGPYAVVSSVDAAIAAVKALECGGSVATVTDADGALRVLATMACAE